MIVTIEDTAIEGDNWRDHNPNDLSQIGGAMPTEYELVTDIPGRPGAILLASKGGAWETMEAYSSRDNFISKGYLYQTESFTFIIGVKSTNHVLEFDLITIFQTPDGRTWRGDGSVQILTDGGWLVMVDGQPPASGAAPSWTSTGLSAPIPFGVPHTVQAEHFTDTASNPPTHSVLRLTVDGREVDVPPQFQKLVCTPSTWPVSSVIQFQITAGAGGGQTDVEFSAISLRHQRTY